MWQQGLLQNWLQSRDHVKERFIVLLPCMVVQQMRKVPAETACLSHGAHVLVNSSAAQSIGFHIVEQSLDEALEFVESSQ